MEYWRKLTLIDRICLIIESSFIMLNQDWCYNLDLLWPRGYRRRGGGPWKGNPVKMSLNWKLFLQNKYRKRIEKSFAWGLKISLQRVVDNVSKDAVTKLKALPHWDLENENESFVTRLKFLLQRVVDSLIVGDDHGVTSHRAVILKTISIHHYPFHFQKKMKKRISNGLGKNMIT